MAYFALIDKNDTVIQVLSVNDVYLIQDGIEVEQKGIDYLLNFHKIKEKIENIDLIRQCSFSHKFRGCFPGVGSKFDRKSELFYQINDEKYDGIVNI